MFVYIFMHKEEYTENLLNKGDTILEDKEGSFKDQCDAFLRDRYIENIGKNPITLLDGLVCGSRLVGYKDADINEFTDEEVVQVEIEIDECREVLVFHSMIYDLRKDKMTVDYFNKELLQTTNCKVTNPNYIGRIVTPISVLNNHMTLQKKSGDCGGNIND